MFINDEIIKNMNNIPPMRPLGHLTAGKGHLETLASIRGTHKAQLNKQYPQTSLSILFRRKGDVERSALWRKRMSWNNWYFWYFWWCDGRVKPKAKGKNSVKERICFLLVNRKNLFDDFAETYRATTPPNSRRQQRWWSPRHSAYWQPVTMRHINIIFDNLVSEQPQKGGW